MFAYLTEKGFVVATSSTGKPLEVAQDRDPNAVTRVELVAGARVWAHASCVSLGRKTFHKHTSGDGTLLKHYEWVPLDDYTPGGEDGPASSEDDD